MEQGFEGTEEAWLASLVGPQGEKGEKGDVGGIDTQFIATYGVTTNAEIEEAYQAGKQVLCFYPDEGLYCPLAKRHSATYHDFVGFRSTLGVLRPYVTDNKWQRGSAEYVSIYSNAQMKANLSLVGDPTQPLHAATKQYVDNRGGSKLVTGTYVGTNENGEEHPNSLTFDFVPKILILWLTNSTWPQNMIINLGSATEEYGHPSPVMSNASSDSGNVEDCYFPITSGVNFKVVGTTVYWYSGSKYWQFNAANDTYAYMAIG